MPTFEKVVPIALGAAEPVGVDGDCAPVLPCGKADSVVGGGGAGVMGGVRAENGEDDDGAGACVVAAGCGATATGAACCAAAVVCQPDVAAPVAVDETFGAATGTAVAVAVLGTPAPGVNPLGTLVPRPASL